MKTLFIITIIGVGGPHGTKPFPIPGVKVAIGHTQRTTGPRGKVIASFPRGRYRVSIKAPCETEATIRLRKPTKLSLFCSIK